MYSTTFTVLSTLLRHLVRTIIVELESFDANDAQAGRRGGGGGASG